MLLTAVKLAFPLVVMQPAFDKYLTPSLEKLVAGQRELPNNNDPVPFCSRLAFAVFIETELVGSKREIHHRQAARRITDFRVLPETSNNYHPVERHGIISFQPHLTGAGAIGYYAYLRIIHSIRYWCLQPFLKDDSGEFA